MPEFIPAQVPTVKAKPTIIKTPRPPVQRAALDPAQRRQSELDNLKRRFKSSFTVTDTTHFSFKLKPTDPDFPFELPASADAFLVTLQVPLDYPTSNLSDCIVSHELLSAQLQKQASKAFLKEFARRTNTSLLSRINWLDKNLERLLIEPSTVTVDAKDGTTIKLVAKQVLQTGSYFQKNYQPSLEHVSEPVHVDSPIDVDLEDQETFVETSNQQNNVVIVRGTHIRLPGLKLTSIVLLNCTQLSLLVQCERCKVLLPINNIDPLKSTKTSCRQCNAVLTIMFRPEMFVHDETTSSDERRGIGYVDVDGCVVGDLLPSNFTVTCSQCAGLHDTDSQIQLRKVAVGQPAAAICRVCHAHVSVNIERVRFIRLASDVLPTAIATASTPKKIKSMKEPGIVPGQPLPLKGACEHYKKSFRWLRFPCCGRAFPCDICHDKESRDNHETKLANRMICGHCSREQPYFSSKPCAHCGADLTKSSGATQFWEGGKGVRDQSKMSRNDSHKYAGHAKTTSNKAERVGPKKKPLNEKKTA